MRKFFGNRKSDEYKEPGESFFKIPDKPLLIPDESHVLGRNTSIKMHYLNTHVENILGNMWDVSDVQGEHCYHQNHGRQISRSLGQSCDGRAIAGAFNKTGS